MRNVMPILVVEDDTGPTERLKTHLEAAALSLQIAIDVEYATHFEPANERLKSGVYPLVILDLMLPVEAGASSSVSEFPGIDLRVIAKQYNKDVFAVGYTGYLQSAADSIIDAKFDLFLNKDIEEFEFRHRVDQALSGAMSRFNYAVDPSKGEPLLHAFPDGQNLGSTEQWEIAFRRVLRRAERDVSYMPFGSGRSGCGILAAYADQELPRILKLGTYSQLRDELRRYEEYVEPKIQFAATTGERELAQAGEAGVLSYSLVGADYAMTTLGHAVLTQSAEAICEAIQNYFRTTCERWFTSPSTLVPHPLAHLCKEHFKLDTGSVVRACAEPAIRPALNIVSEQIGGVTPEDVARQVQEALEAERRRVVSRAPEIMHGDLNASNLIWDDGRLWMVDFAQTGPGFRLFDMVKLETSIKYDVNHGSGDKMDNEKLESRLVAEEYLLSTIVPQGDLPVRISDLWVRKKIIIVKAIRACYVDEAGRAPEDAYRLCLFLLTAKYIQYLAEDCLAKQDRYLPLCHALWSAYHLAGQIRGSVRT